MVVRGSLFGAVTGLRFLTAMTSRLLLLGLLLGEMEERQLLHVGVALLRELNGRGGLADQAEIGQIFAGAA